jgi:predicted Zn-dependent protease
LAYKHHEGPEFDKVRKAAEALLALKPAAQKAALLKAVIMNKERRGGERNPVKAKEHALLTKLDTTGALVDELIRLAKDDARTSSVHVRIALRKVGGRVALTRLEKLATNRSPWTSKELDELIKTIRVRLGTTQDRSLTTWFYWRSKRKDWRDVDRGYVSRL